jgi:hypothetical protein
LHRGLATGSNVTPIRIPAPKADLPGVPAILTRGSPLLGNRQVLMSFLKTKAFGGGASQGSSINTNSVPLPDDCDPGFTNVNFESDDEPEDPPLPPEDQGGSPLEPGEPPPPPVNFNCTPSGCVRSATGTFDTLPECEAVCQQRYSCENSNCVPDPNGTHANLSLCLNACQSRYTCIDGTCVAFPTGGFATLIDCVEACGAPRWDCVSGTCTQTDESGEFATLADCVSSGCSCRVYVWEVTTRIRLNDTPQNSCFDFDNYEETQTTQILSGDTPTSNGDCTATTICGPVTNRPAVWGLGFACLLCNITVVSFSATKVCDNPFYPC